MHADREGRDRTRNVAFAFGAALLLAAAALLASLPVAARDLVVFGEPTLQPALRAVGILWQARTGTRVNVFVAPPALSLAQIERGARCDVIVALPGSATQAAADRKVIEGATIARVLRNGLVLVGTEHIGTPTALAEPADLARLIAGRVLAIADPGRDAAGVHAAALLRQAGIAIHDGNKTVAVAESSAGVVNLLDTGKARLGIVHASDATANPGFRLRLAIPAFGLAPIDYVVAQARDPALDPRPFIEFLRSAEAKSAFAAAGLQPIGP
jgi:molybdenum ABC transporter molybdate-binding protein